VSQEYSSRSTYLWKYLRRSIYINFLLAIQEPIIDKRYWKKNNPHIIKFYKVGIGTVSNKKTTGSYEHRYHIETKLVTKADDFYTHPENPDYSGCISKKP
jgi:hypothetical protein